MSNSVQSPVPLATPLPENLSGTSSGVIVLDAVVFVLGVAILGDALWWITKKILIDEKY